MASVKHRPGLVGSRFLGSDFENTFDIQTHLMLYLGFCVCLEKQTLDKTLKSLFGLKGFKGD